MYLYYANVQSIRPYAKYLTALQIVQLFSGVYMNVLSYHHQSDAVYRYGSIVNGSLCLSYGVLFVRFFRAKYATPRLRTRERVE